MEKRGERRGAYFNPHFLRHPIETQIPKHERGAGKDALEDLIKLGFVVEKITGYGRHVSLNPKVIAEVHAILAEEQ